MKFTLYLSNVYQRKGNTLYKEKTEINDAQELKAAVSKYDYTAFRFTDYMRGGRDPLSTDCVVLEFDNDHSVNPEDWIKPSDIKINAELYLFTSKSHMIEKDGKPACPRFRVLFPFGEEAKDPERMRQVIDYLVGKFPLCDKGVAIDLQRFYYANKNTKVIYREGPSILSIVDGKTFYEETKNGKTGDDTIKDGYETPEGNIGKNRNTELKRFAGHIRNDYIDKTIEELFDELAKFNIDHNSPPLSEKEIRSTVLKSTWKEILKIRSAREEVGREHKQRLEYAFNDVGTSEFLRDTMGRGLRYCHDQKDWFYFKDGVWKRDDVGRAHSRARAAFRKWKKDIFLLPDAIQQGEGLEWLGKLTSYESCERVIKETRHLLSITPQDFDTNDRLLNFKNGTLNLDTKEFYKHNIEEYHTKQTNCNYNADAAPSDMWMDFINTIFEGNQELISYIQKIMGLSVIGKNGREEFFIFHGSGKNGKSQFIAVFQDIFGSYAEVLGAEKVMENRYANNDTYFATLRNARTLFLSESKENAFLDIALVKKLTDSSADYKVAQKYERPITFRLKMTSFLITNNKPIINETTDAVWRRIKLVHFNYQVPDDKRILKYADRLIESGAEGIANWFIEGYWKSKTEGVKEPDYVKVTTQQYKTSSDAIQKFIDDKCAIDPEVKEKVSEMKSAFLIFTELKKYRLFEDKMNEKGYLSKRYNDGMYLLGIHLKNHTQSVDGDFE